MGKKTTNGNGVHYSNKNLSTLKICTLCKKLIKHDEPHSTLREAQAGRPPSETDKIVGWAHENCGLRQEIQRLTEVCKQLEEHWRNTSNLAAALVEAAGGSIRVASELPDRVAADGNKINILKQGDGSWKVERPSLIISPAGAVLPPPPSTLSTRRK